MSGGIPAATASAPAHGGSQGEARVDVVGGVQHDADSGEETGEQEEERRQQQRRSQQQSEQESPPRQQHKQPRRQHQRRQVKQQQQQQQEEEEMEGKRSCRSSSLLSRRSMSPCAGDGGCGARARGSPGVAQFHLDMPPPNSPATASGPKTVQRGSVQRLLEEEGHDARNVVSWLVPNLSNGGGGGSSGGPGGIVVDARAEAVRGGGAPAGRSWRAQQQQQARGLKGERLSREGSRERDHSRRKSPMSSPFKGSNESQASSKGTPGRGSSDSMTQGFNQRLWGYLFRNVNRAVDELYYLCEAEGSATHCTEAAELLEGCGRDFSKLIERIADQKRFEEEQRAARAAERASPEVPKEGGYASATEPGSRTPKGLVWEVRKTTSASTASAMVLNAIERMESHASSKEQVCSAGRRGTDTTRSGALRVDGGGGDPRTAPSACVATNTAISTATEEAATAAAAAAAAATPPSRVPGPSLVSSDLREGDGTVLRRDRALSGKSHRYNGQADGSDSPCPDPTQGLTAAVGERSAARAAGPSSVAGTSSIVDRRVSGRGATKGNSLCSGRSASFDDVEAAAVATPPVILFGSLGDDDGMDGDCGRAATGEVQVDHCVASTALASREVAEVGPRSATIDEPAPAAEDLRPDEASAAPAVACGGGGGGGGVQEDKEGHVHEEERFRMEMEMGSDKAEHGGITIAEGKEGCGGPQEEGSGDAKGLASRGRSPEVRDTLKAAGRPDDRPVAAAGPAAAAAATSDAATAVAAAACGAPTCAAAASAAAKRPASRDQLEGTCRQEHTGNGPSSGTAAAIANGGGAAAGLSSKRNHPVPRKNTSRLNPRAAPFRFDSAAACSASAAELDHGGIRSATPNAHAPASTQTLLAPASTPTAARARTPATTAPASASTAATSGENRSRERNRSLGPAGHSKLAEAKREATAIAAPDGSDASSPATSVPPDPSPSTGAPAPHARRAQEPEDSTTAGASPSSVKLESGGDGDEDRSSAPSGKSQKQRQRQRQRQKKKRKAASLKVAGQEGGGPSGIADSKEDARAVACVVPASAPAAAVDALRCGGCSSGAYGTPERSAAQSHGSSLPLLPGVAATAAATAVPGPPRFATVEPRSREHSADGQSESVEFVSGQTGKGDGGDGGDVTGHDKGLERAQDTSHAVAGAHTDEAAAGTAPVLSPPPPPSLPASGNSDTVLQNGKLREKSVGCEAGLNEQPKAEAARLARQGCGESTEQEEERGGGVGAAREDNQEEDDDEEEDPDSAYVNAMEEIWAEAEAWVDAEAQAEEEAWARLPEDVPCCGPSESDGGGPLSDVEEPLLPTASAGEHGTTAAAVTVCAAAEQRHLCSSSGRLSTPCGSRDYDVRVDDDNDVDNGSTSAVAGAAGKEGGPSATLSARKGPSGQQARASSRASTRSGRGARAVAPLSGEEGGKESDGDDGDDKGTLLELEIEIPAAGEDDADADGALLESWDRPGERSDMEVDRLSEEIDGEDAGVKSNLGRANSNDLLGNEASASGGGSGGTGRRKADDRQLEGGRWLLPLSASAVSSGFKAAAVSKAGDGEGNGGHLLLRPHTQHSPHQKVDSGGGGSVVQEGYPSITRTPSGSGASCFSVERGSSCEVPEGWGPFPHRELQKKLSSPQRKPQRKILSAAEAKLRQERRQMMAELNRAMRANGITEKLKQHEERARGVRFRKEVQLLKAEEEAKRKMEGADARRKEHRRGIVRKANDANSKVEEVLFMNKLTVEDLKITLQMKLAEVDRRIQGGRARRQQLLAGISDRQRKRTRDKAAQMSEKRVEAEAATAMRWEALQERLEVVQQRRRDRARETSRRMQAANRHAKARERRKAMLHLPARGSAPEGKQGGSRAAVGLVDSRRKGPNAAAVAADKQVRISRGRGNGEGGSDHNVIDNGRSECTASNSSDTHTARNRNADPDADKSGPPAGASFRQRAGRPSTKASSFPQLLARRSSSPPEAASAAVSGSLSEGPDSAPFATAATACHRRGRAQKKRARKVKNRTRQLCLDSYTAAPTAEAPTPWPRLDRAARALAELARAKAQLADRKPAAQVVRPPADAAAIRNPAEGLAAASTTAPGDDGGGSPMPAVTAGASDTIIPREAHQNAEHQQAVGNSRDDGSETAAKEPRAAAAGLLVGAAAGAVRTAGKGRAAVLLAEAAAGEPRETSRSDGEASGYGSSGVDQSASEPFPTHRKTRRGKRAGGAINRRRGAKARAAAGLLAAAASAGPSTSSPCAVPVADVVEEPASGGRFEQPGGFTGEGGSGRNRGDAECSDGGESGSGPARRQQQGHGATLAADGGSRATVCRSGRVANEAVPGTGTTDACAAAVSVGSESDRASVSDERKRNGPFLPAAGAAVAVDDGPPLEKSSPSLPQPPGSTRRRSAVESAAWTSLRELRGMCPPPSFAASCPWSPAVPHAEGSPARHVPPDPHSDAAVSDRPTAAASATADVRSGVNHGLLAQMKARGVFESLVAICAPFPWTPVSPPVDLGATRGGGKQRDRRASASSVAHDAAAHDSKAQQVGTRTLSSSLAASTSEPGDSLAYPERGSCADTVSRSEIGDAGIGSGRELMTEMALDVLFGALVDDAGNREHVLRIDGGAALVDCLSRLLERATRHGDTSKGPLPRPRPPLFLQGAVADARTEVEEDCNKISGLSPKRVTEQGKRLEEAATAMAKTEASRELNRDSTTCQGGSYYSRRVVNQGPGVELPATSRALCERVVGAEVEVEDSLLTALAVVSLLVRHKALDESVTRIQEGLVRYLVTKRLLHDLSVLARQLHPFCTAAAAAAAAASTSPIETTIPRGSKEKGARQQPDTFGYNQQGRSPPPPLFSPLRSPSSGRGTAAEPVPMVMSTGTGTMSAEIRHSFRSPPQGSPLSAPAPPRLVLCRKSTGVGSNRSSSRPPSPSRLSSTQPSSPPQLPPPQLPPPLVQVAGRIAELVDAVTAHPLLGARKRSSTTPIPPPAVAATAAEGAMAPAATAVTVEASASALSPSSPRTRESAGPDRAWSLSSGMPGVLGSLVSLLAAIVGAEKRHKRRQQQQQQQRVEERPLSHLGVQGVVTLPEDGHCDTSAAAGAAASATGGRSPRTSPPPALADCRRMTARAKAVSEAMAATGTATTVVTASPATASFGLSDGTLRLVSVVVRAVNRACLDDLAAVQDTLSLRGVRPEFAFLCDHLLAALVERVDAQEVTRPDSKPTELEEWMEGVVTLIGYFCLDDPAHQAFLNQGPSPTVLQRLCNLPFRYFSEPRHRSVLLPTLVSICNDNVGNRLAAENYLHAEFLASFLEEHLQEHCASDLPAGAGAVGGLAAAATARAQSGKPGGVGSIIADRTTTSDGHGEDAPAAVAVAPAAASLPEQIQSSGCRSALSARFPRELWENAILFFKLDPCSRGAR